MADLHSSISRGFPLDQEEEHVGVHKVAVAFLADVS